ncbi:MAG TPA: murein biosynthesis integral membrane protein MurJ [Phycisphaerae bacterium]|nr:murein biosynthesis integral membrane protein MurJ [Phycisphaerae bacterium]
MSKDRFVRHANLMSGLTIVSRVAGLVRDKLWSAYLALGTPFSSFTMGFQFPNLFRRLFGEGALTAIFVPVYTRIQKEQGQEAANRLAAATTSFLLLVLGGITLLGELILIPIAMSSRVTPNNAFTALMLAIMLPYCIMICLVALYSAIASVHERFTAQSISPIILNLVTAAAAVLPVMMYTAAYPIRKRVVWVAVSVIVAGVLQLLQMMPTLRRCGVRLKLSTRFKSTGIGEVLKPLLPMIVGLSAVQFNVFMDGQIAYWLSSDGHNDNNFFTLMGHVVHLPLGKGALAKLFVAQRLYMLPVGIFGVSMATAIFPMLSKAAASNDVPEMKRLLVAGLRKTLFLSFPTSFGMIIVSRLLITLIYSGPDVSVSDIDRAAWATIWFCVGIWCFETQLVILRVFYAMRDTKTPMKTAVAMVVLNFSLNITLVWFMQEGGLALATSISALVQSMVLMAILRKRLGRLGIRSLGTTVGLSLLATLVMVEVGLLIRGIHLPWDAAPALSPVGMRAKILTALVKLPLIVAASAGVYLGITWFFGMPELADLPLLGRYLKRASADRASN